MQQEYGECSMAGKRCGLGPNLSCTRLSALRVARSEWAMKSESRLKEEEYTHAYVTRGRRRREVGLGCDQKAVCQEDTSASQYNESPR